MGRHGGPTAFRDFSFTPSSPEVFIEPFPVTTGVTQPKTQRLASLDAYRGFVMFLMLAEVLRLCRVAAALPESGFWKFLCHHQSHVEWIGCSLHDLIQPSFSFIDRKSTRLNSSHLVISYAVFCLKKKSRPHS